MTAQTPGQAAREAFGELGADWYPGTPWNGLHEDLRAQWEAAAQAGHAAIAAQEPHPAPCAPLRMILGRCPVHTGKVHAQLGDNDEWFCLRDLADTAEAVGNDEPDSAREAIDAQTLIDSPGSDL